MGLERSLLEHGIPSHDTFGDIFGAIKPETFADAFSKWVETLRSKVSGEIVSLDGKTIGASLDAVNRRKAVHVVSAWATSNRTNSNR